MNPSQSQQVEDAVKKYGRGVLQAAAMMARGFDGYSVTPPYEWTAVRDGIAKMIEELAESIK